MTKLILFALGVLPLTVMADGGLPNQPYIYIEGKSGIEKAPDIITLHFLVKGRKVDQLKANEEAQAKVKKVFALLTEAKIADRDVVAQDLHSEPEYENDESDQRKRGKLIGYVVTRPFEVSVRELTKYGKLADHILAVGGVEFSYIAGDLSNREEVGDQLWPKAIADARTRAEKTLKPMGMKIDSVFAVSSIDFAEIKSKFITSGERVVVTGSNIPAPPDEPSQYRPEMVTITSTAHVIYLISAAK